MPTIVTYDIADYQIADPYRDVRAAGARLIKNEMFLSEMNMQNHLSQGVEFLVLRPDYPVADPRYPDQLTLDIAFKTIRELLDKKDFPADRVAFELLCEPEVDTADKIQRLADYYAQAIDVLHGWGTHIAVLSLSVGNPPKAMFPELKRLTQMLLKLGPKDVLALHYYFCDPAKYPQNSVPPEYVLEILDALDVDVDTVLTEYGHDIWGDPVNGYKNNYEPPYDGYIDDLFARAAVLERNPRIKAATTFNYGNVYKWKDFDVSGIAPRISDRARALGGGRVLDWQLPKLKKPQPEPPMPEPIINFSIEPTTGPAGTPVTLHFQADYVAGGWYNENDGKWNDLAPATQNKIVQPAATTKYTFRVLPKPGAEYTYRAATFTVTEEPEPPEPPTPPSDCWIDPRIADRIKVTQGKEYKCLGVWFMNDTKVPFAKADNSQTESRGNVDSRLVVLDKNNRPLPGVWCVLDWPDGCDPRLSECDGTVVWELYSDGYNIQVGDCRIDGIGLIGKHHVRYQIQVQKVG